MLFAAAVTLLGLVGVLVAVYREQPLPPRPPPALAWDGLPTPAEVASTGFPTRLRGYDPVRVEAHLDGVAQAYAALLAVTPPEVLARARARYAAHAAPGATAPGAHAGSGSGADAEDRPENAGAAEVDVGHAAPAPAWPAHLPTATTPALSTGDDGDALRTEVALSMLAARQRT